MKFRDLTRIIINDGWYLKRQRGSHKHYRHNIKPGLVTIAGKGNSEVPIKTLKSILTQANIKLK